MFIELTLMIMLSCILFFSLNSYDFGFFTTYLNLVKSPKKQADLLYDQTLKLNKFYLSKGEDIHLNSYKFFTHLIEELLRLNRSIGIDIFDNLSKIRGALQVDSIRSQKVLSLIKGAIFEILLITLMSWGVVLFAIHFTGLSFKANDLFIVATMQVLGLLILIISIERRHKSLFSKVFAYIKCVYSLEVYIKAKSPVNELSKLIGLETLHFDKDLIHIKERVEVVLKTISSYGRVDPLVVCDLINQTWSSFDVKSDKFKKECLKIKLFVIMGVIVPSYLYIFYALLKSITL